MLTRLEQILEKSSEINEELKQQDPNFMLTNRPNDEMSELKEIQVSIDKLYGQYQHRRDEILQLSEEYEHLQQRIRVKLRKQEILNRKHHQLLIQEKRMKATLKPVARPAKAS